MEKKVYELKIDPELRDFIPPLSEIEFNNLGESILQNGCEDALIVWNGTIVDGHNRYLICCRHNIPFAIQEKEFENKEQAKLWMARRQLGRRNLKPFQKCELVIPLENALKEEAETRRRQKIAQYRTSGETVKKSSPSKKTRDIMAEMADVSFDTLNKARKILEKGDEKDKEDLRAGKVKINKVYEKIVKQEKPEEPQKTEEPKKSKESSSPEYNHIVNMDGPFEVPCDRGEKEQTTRPYEFVKNQVWFAMENMLKELSLGLSWLQEEDKEHIPELRAMVKDGTRRAIELFSKKEG